MAVLTEEQFAQKWGDKSKGRFADNTIQNFDEALFREFQEDVKDSFVPRDATPDLSNNAVFLKQENGQATFALSFATRLLKRLRLRRFVGGTLPAILPAPVLAADRPTIAAPGVAFTLHSSIGGPATGPAAIAEYTRQVSDGGQFLLTGADLDQAAYPVYQHGLFLATTVTSQHRQRASVRLPRTGAAWDAALTWPSTAAGIGEPVLLNTAVLLWGTEQTAAGLTFSVYGRNLAHGNVDGGASYVALQPVAGGLVQVLTGTALDPYCADFVTPNLPLGDYYYWPHNGHGGDYGWGERGVITVVATENHVKSHGFGPATLVKLSKTDPALNVATINAAFQQYRHFCTDDDTFPINAQLYPRDNTKWSCVSPTGRTVIEATSWAKTSQYLGMFGSNSWYMGMLERISFIDPGDVVPYKTTPGYHNQSLIDLRRGSGQTGNEHIWLKDVEATWLRPYYELNMGSYSIPEEAQCLHVEGARHFFVDRFRSTGSGNHFGNCGQVFIEDYAHWLRNGADHTLYGLHVNGFSVRGFSFQDDDPTSGNGLTRGAGRGPKFGGQGGSNQNTYLRDLNGRLLGPLFTGINPYFDRNQGEMCLYEGNRVVWQNMVVSATATTITFAGPVLSNPAAVANGTTSPDKPAAGVLPDYHLLWIGRGRGIDQVRGIVSVNGNTITLDKPLRVIPDATSFVQVGTFTRGNTLSKVKLTGKRFVVDDTEFGIQCAINFYGGMFDTIADDFDVTDTRHGFIFTPTVHGDGQIDTVAFCQMLNSKFNGQRWVERYESYGKEEELFWSFGCSGLRNILVANIEATNWLEARVVFKVVRETSELATYWRPDAPPIDGLVRDGMPVVASYLNDYRTPAGPTKFPPIQLVAGVVEGFVQQPEQVQVAPTAPGVQLVVGNDLGPLEPLPATAAIDTYGRLTFPESGQVMLVLLDGKQRDVPLARTQAVGTGGPVATGATYTAGAGIAISPTNEISLDNPLSPEILAGLNGNPPTRPGSFYARLEDIPAPYVLPQQPYGFVGNPANQNVVFGVFGNNNAGTFTRNFFGQLCSGNTWGNDFYHNTLEDNFIGNTIGSGFAENHVGHYFTFNTIGVNLTFSTFGTYTTRNKIGNNCRGLVFGNHCNYNEIGDDCANIELVNCTNLVVPAGSSNLYYRDNQLVTGGAPGGGGVTYTAGTGVDLNGNQFSSTRLELAEQQTGSYDLQLADAGKLVPFVNTSPAVLTFPANADVALPVGTIGYVRRQAAGALTLQAGNGVQLLPPNVGLNLDEYAKVSWHKIDLNTYWLEGSLF